MIRVGIQNPQIIYKEIKKQRKKPEQINLEAMVLTDENYYKSNNKKKVFSNQKINVEFPRTSQTDDIIDFLTSIEEIELSLVSDGEKYGTSVRVRSAPYFNKQDIENLEEHVTFTDSLKYHYISGKFVDVNSDDGCKSYERSFSFKPQKGWFKRPKYKKVLNLQETFKIDFAFFSKVVKQTIDGVYDVIRAGGYDVPDPDLDIQIVAPGEADPDRFILDVPSFSIENTTGTPIYTFYNDNSGEYKTGDVKLIGTLNNPVIKEERKRLDSYLKFQEKYAGKEDYDKYNKNLESIQKQYNTIKDKLSKNTELQKFDSYVHSRLKKCKELIEDQNEP